MKNSLARSSTVVFLRFADTKPFSASSPAVAGTVSAWESSTGAAPAASSAAVPEPITTLTEERATDSTSSARPRSSADSYSHAPLEPCWRCVARDLVQQLELLLLDQVVKSSLVVGLSTWPAYSGGPNWTWPW
eukprot:2512944-Amphidinium_carterae.1